jgi:hypothetical protein
MEGSKDIISLFKTPKEARKTSFDKYRQFWARALKKVGQAWPTAILAKPVFQATHYVLFPQFLPNKQVG